MAKLKSFSLITTFIFFAIVMMSRSACSEEEDVTGPAADDDYSAPSPEEFDFHNVSNDEAPPSDPANVDFLRDCAEKVTKECSEDLFLYIFQDTPLSKPCCSQLVKMGETCHTALIKNAFTLPIYKGDAAMGIPRSKQLWKKCSAIVAGVESPSPLSSS
ncbi:Protein of unknown function (DUF784) [Melia azedarach]|uniref:Uncharacterized protein n=1 Tax=Melia azedarach TaxID=155640 RepID=A0ACC1XEA4_MELAZ|nr:Protein of unknown function (DUF784) [Melia azedarach]